MIFKYLDYRKYIADWVQTRKERGFAVTFHSLSEWMRIQKSYFSRVMKGDADLNGDQAFLLARAMELDKEESAYFSLLVEWSRASLKERKQVLLEEIQTIQRRKISSESVLSKTEPQVENLQSYYLNPLNQLLHIALTDAASAPASLRQMAHKFGIEEREFFALTEALLQQGLLKKEGSKFVNQAGQMHLKRSHPLTKVNHVLHRAHALARLMASDFERNYTFTATFSADEATFTQVKSAFMEFLKAVEAPIEKAPAKNCFQMNFDLFPWAVFE